MSRHQLRWFDRGRLDALYDCNYLSGSVVSVQDTDDIVREVELLTQIDHDVRELLQVAQLRLHSDAIVAHTSRLGQHNEQD